MFKGPSNTSAQDRTPTGLQKYSISDINALEYLFIYTTKDIFSKLIMIS